MKKNQLAVGISLFSLLALASCQMSPLANRKDKVIVNEVIVNKEVDRSYALSVESADGILVSIVDATSDSKYFAGDTVKFTVKVQDGFELTSILVGGKRPSFDKGTYDFVMPDHDVVIKPTSVKANEFDGTVEDVTSLPTALTNEDYQTAENQTAFINDLKDRLNASDAAEMDSIKSVKIKTVKENKLFVDLGFPTSTNASATSSVKVVKGTKGQGLKVTTSYSENGKSYYTKNFERGLQGNFYYEMDSKNCYYSSSSEYLDEKTTLDRFEIVDDEIEKPASTQIKESEASYQSSAIGFGSKIIKNYFNASYSALDYVTSGKYKYVLRDVSVKKAADNKSFEYGFSFVNASSYEIKKFNMVFDGNQLLKKVDYQYVTYSSKDFDKTAMAPVDGATAKSTTGFSYEVETGYRYTDGLSNLSKMAMKDYDVGIYTYLDGASMSTYDEYSFDHKVFDGMKLRKFYFKNNSNVFGNKAVLLPTFIGTDKGEEDFIKNVGGDLFVDKVGTFHLNFDNGFGEIKRVEVVSTTPKAENVYAQFKNAAGDKVESGNVGVSLMLDVSVKPNKANQAYHVEVAEDDTASTTLTKNQDGTYKIDFAKEGTASLNVISDENDQVRKNVTLTVFGTLELDPLKSNLQNKMLKGTYTESSYYYGNKTYTTYILFNPDSTGLAGIGQMKLSYLETEEDEDDYHAVSTVMTFKWTLDPTTMEFTVSKDDTEGATTRSEVKISSGSTRYYDVKAIMMKSSSKGSFTLNEFSTATSSYVSDNYTGDFSFEDKVDFETIK